jgi:flagellar biosynthesis protein FlhB
MRRIATLMAALASDAVAARLAAVALDLARLAPVAGLGRAAACQRQFSLLREMIGIAVAIAFAITVAAAASCCR